MKKICFVINYITTGGPSRVILNIIKSLEKTNYEVTVLTLKSKKNDNEVLDVLKSLNVNIMEFTFKSNMDIITNQKKVTNKITADGFDIIHSHGIIPDYIISKLNKTTTIMTTIHNNMYEDYLFEYGSIKSKILIWLHQKALRKFNYVICCSKTVFDSLNGKVDNLFYVRNGIDIEDLSSSNEIRNELCIPKEAVIFTYCGVMTSRKRILELVDMFSKDIKENEYFLVIGQKGNFYEDVLKYDSDHIKILGYQDDVNKYLSISDVYVSYSSSEGLSISVIEAMSKGLYLLLSDIPSHIECIDIDDSIYIGEKFNKNNFCERKAKIVDHVLKRNNDEIRKIKNVQKKYLSSESMSNGYKKFYEIVFEGKGNK